MKKLLIAVCLLASSSVLSAPPILVDPSTGRYLGSTSTNRYAPDSINNPYGRYGNQYSPDSVNNPYGKYGSRYSNDSANNPYATNAPILIVDD